MGLLPFTTRLRRNNKTLDSAYDWIAIARPLPHYPPWRVEMNVTLSPGSSTESSNPLNSQSASLISTRTPGRIVSPFMNISGLSFKRLSRIQAIVSLTVVVQPSPCSVSPVWGGTSTTMFRWLSNNSSIPPLQESNTHLWYIEAWNIALKSQRPGAMRCTTNSRSNCIPKLELKLDHNDRSWW